MNWCIWFEVRVISRTSQEINLKDIFITLILCFSYRIVYLVFLFDSIDLHLFKESKKWGREMWNERSRHASQTSIYPRLNTSSTISFLILFPDIRDSLHLKNTHPKNKSKNIRINLVNACLKLWWLFHSLCNKLELPHSYS